MLKHVLWCVWQGSLVALTLDRSSPADTRALCHASHEGGDGTSVWFDKPISILTFANGKCGVNAEHGHFDAPVPGRLFAFVSKHVGRAEALHDAPTPPGAALPAVGRANATPAFDGPTAPSSTSSVGPTWHALAPATWHALEFDRLPPLVTTALAGAPTAFEATRAGNTLVPVRFDGGGRQEALALRPLSADSVIQMALQLAQMRDQGEVVATYAAPSNPTPPPSCYCP